MATTRQPGRTRAPAAARRGHHPGIALTIIACAQLMVVLDATIVNIALPHIQRALGFSTTSLSWVLNAYTLTFGGLLLLGGRAGDLLGRRRMFIVGVLLFAGASLAGGFATTEAWLLACRALQGVGGAIAAPTALALITTNFAEGPERNRAFGVYAGVSGAGAAVGLLLGGILTSWLSWRWVFFVNAPIGLALALLAPLFINESERREGHFDLAGALTATAGMTALVYGFISAAQHGWRATGTVLAFGSAAVLLVGYLLIELRSTQPITPLHLFRDRNRSATYVTMLALAAALFSMFFFLTLFIQDILGYSPLRAGLAFLPVTVVIIIASQLVALRLQRIGVKPFMLAGGILATGGLLWLSRLSPTSSYFTGILGPSVVFALGMGCFFVPVTVTALAGVRAEESGAASSLLNVMQQVGSSLGLSILVTVFGTASRNEARAQAAQVLTHPGAARQSFLTTHQLPAQAAAQVLTHGISTALETSIVFSAIALLAVIVGVRNVKPTGMPGMGPVPEPTAQVASEAA